VNSDTGKPVIVDDSRLTASEFEKVKIAETIHEHGSAKARGSPLLFGEFLMQLCAFVFLEDVSRELPPYEETYLSVSMDEPMREAYQELEDDMRKALRAHRGNRSVLSTMLTLAGSGLTSSRQRQAMSRSEASMKNLTCWRSFRRPVWLIGIG
jgi:hypothetical protein